MPSTDDTAFAGDTAEGKPRLVLVMNAKAGALMAQAGGGGTLEDLLRAEASELNLVPEDSGDLPARVARAQTAGADVVVIAGGDGTVACAAQIMAGTDGVLGLVPCGTMNLLAHDLGLDPENHHACVRVLTDGQARAIDTGEVVDAAGARHVFTCASMIGTPARLSRHREAGRARGNGVLAWAGFGLAAVRALWRNRSMRLVLRYDGQVRRVRTPSLTIVVGALNDASGRMFGRARLDQGTLALYLVRRSSVLGQVMTMLRAALRGAAGTPNIEVILTKTVEVHGAHRAIHVLVDGERRLLKPRLHYRVCPTALKIMAPA